MNDVEWEFYVRSLLNEENPRHWMAEDIAIYKKVALSIVNGYFWNLLLPLRKKIYNLSIVVDSPNKLAREDVLPADCQKVRRIEYAETGDKLTYVQDEWFYLYAGLSPGNPVAWCFQDSKLYWFPEPNQNLSNYIRLWYLPRATLLSHLPEELHPLIAVEAVISARIKDENVSPALQQLRQQYFNTALKYLSIAQAQDPDVVGEIDRYEDQLDR